MYSKDLILPHIDMHNRRFVLEPLMQIAPYAEHPVLRKSVRQLFEEEQVREGCERPHVE